MYFIIFKKDNRYRHYTNEIFQTEEDAIDYAKRSMKRKDKWKVLIYDSENIKKYWW